MSTGASQEKQSTPASKQVKDGDFENTYNTPPASLGDSGKISPNSSSRGKQGNS